MKQELSAELNFLACHTWVHAHETFQKDVGMLIQQTNQSKLAEQKHEISVKTLNSTSSRNVNSIEYESQTINK